MNIHPFLFCVTFTEILLPRSHYATFSVKNGYTVIARKKLFKGN